MITLEGPFEFDGCTDYINVYTLLEQMQWSEFIAAYGGVL